MWHLWLSDWCRILSPFRMMFHWTSVTYASNHMDKHLFLTSEMLLSQTLYVCILRKSEFKSSAITSVSTPIMISLSLLLKWIKCFLLLPSDDINLILLVKYILNFSDVLRFPVISCRYSLNFWRYCSTDGLSLSSLSPATFYHEGHLQSFLICSLWLCCCQF